MATTRRIFLGKSAVGVAAALTVRRTEAASRAATPQRRSASRPRYVRPPRLRAGDTVGLVNPGGVPPSAGDIDLVAKQLAALGLGVKVAPHVGDSAATPEGRAQDLGTMFSDPAVKAILPLRGGWGCARLLQHLDYRLISRHPKVLMGFSDVAALLNGIHARTGLVTFHGPMGISTLEPFTAAQVKKILFDASAATLAHPDGRPIRTITSGSARGRLLGGNLTVLASMVGTPFLRSGGDVILFLEEVREPVSEIDRMLTQLDLSGILRNIRGLVFGQCTNCASPMLDQSLTLRRVLDDHVRPLGVPAWAGAMIGHVDAQFTLPIGLPVEIDAGRGTIRLLEPAVT